MIERSASLDTVDLQRLAPMAPRARAKKKIALLFLISDTKKP